MITRSVQSILTLLLSSSLEASKRHKAFVHGNAGNASPGGKKKQKNKKHNFLARPRRYYSSCKKHWDPLLLTTTPFSLAASCHVSKTYAVAYTSTTSMRDIYHWSSPILTTRRRYEGVPTPLPRLAPQWLSDPSYPTEFLNRVHSELPA